MPALDREDRGALTKRRVAAREAEFTRRMKRRARKREAEKPAPVAVKRVFDRPQERPKPDTRYSGDSAATASERLREKRATEARAKAKATHERARERDRRKRLSRIGDKPKPAGIRIPGTKTILGDIKQIGYGVADAAADYGSAVARDVKDIRDPVPFRRTAGLARRDAIGFAATLEAATPEAPGWVPEFLKKEAFRVDPEKGTISFKHTGEKDTDPEGGKRFRKFWREDPLIGALLVTPAGSAFARQASRGAIKGSIQRANPDMGKREAGKLARKESKLPGYAAAHGVKGGISPRELKGEFMEATGRPLSRHPIGRAGQRAYDRGSELIEATRGPGAKFSTSQRAARMQERRGRKATQHKQAEITRLERRIAKGIGQRGRGRPGQEALVATLEAPKGLTPRQAVEIKLADLRSTIERPRSHEEARARVDALDKRIDKGLRPIVDREYPAAGRQREQGMRNIAPHTRGKRARAGLEREIEMTGLEGQSSSVLANAYAKVEERVLEIAAKPDADPIFKKVAVMIAERDRLREQVNDPDVLFGDAAGDFGVAGASAASAGRLRAQVAALEKALESGRLDGPEFAAAVEAAEGLSVRADASAARWLTMDAGQLADRRNVVARRYAEKGLLPEGVEPEARGFFPHRDAFENVSGAMGAPTLPATGSVIGVPQKGKAFERRQNKLRRYEQGQVQTNPRVLSNTVRQRTRYEQTHEARKKLYDSGQPIRSKAEIPDGAMLLRNPDKAPEQIPPNVRAAIENPERYAELVERAGEFPKVETFKQWVDSFLYRGDGPEPEWMADLANVRAVPEGVVTTMLADVFRSAPRGSLMSILGTLNAVARAVTIYTPYLGARYVIRNTAQNMVLLAVTRPTAFLNLRQATIRLRRSDPELYDALKVETGTIQAAAGLPELAGKKQGWTQKTEERAVVGSRKIASVLGEAADEPWRLSAQIGYMRDYGFKTPADWRRLMFSDDPALVRVRDDIGQRVRDDMLDFDALPPGARETLSRVFFILPFKYAAAKWPFMYLREYPVRSAVMALIAAQHAREETPGRATSVLESGRTEIAGHETDIGWLMPQNPSAETIEDLGKTVQGLDPDNINLRPVAGMLSPQYRSAIDAGGYSGEPTEQIAGFMVPGFSTMDKIRRGGGPGEQVLRGLGSTIDYIEPGGDPAERTRSKAQGEKRELLKQVRELYPDEFKQEGRAIAQAFDRRTTVEVARAEVERQYEGDDAHRRKYVAELDILESWGVLSDAERAEVETLKRSSLTAPIEQVKKARRYLVDHAFDGAYLEILRNVRNAVEAKSSG